MELTTQHFLIKISYSYRYYNCDIDPSLVPRTDFWRVENANKVRNLGTTGKEICVVLSELSYSLG